MFYYIDKDNSGRISKSELAEAVKNCQCLELFYDYGDQCHNIDLENAMQTDTNEEREENEIDFNSFLSAAIDH